MCAEVGFTGARGPALTVVPGPSDANWTGARSVLPCGRSYCQADVKSAAFSFVTSVVPVSMAFT